MRLHIIVYAVFIGFIVLDLATSIICFQRDGLIETNLPYQIVGVWAFPIVYLIDAGLLATVEWLRKYIRWSPMILFIPIAASVRASIINIQLILA